MGGGGGALGENPLGLKIVSSLLILFHPFYAKWFSATVGSEREKGACWPLSKSPPNPLLRLSLRKRWKRKRKKPRNLNIVCQGRRRLSRADGGDGSNNEKCRDGRGACRRQTMGKFSFFREIEFRAISCLSRVWANHSRIFWMREEEGNHNGSLLRYLSQSPTEQTRPKMEWKRCKNS